MSANQVYFEDVEVGHQIPPLGPVVWDTPDILRFTSAVELYEHLHHDRRLVKEQGFPDTLINGPIKNSMLSMMLTDWIGPGGFLKKLSAQHRGMDTPANALTATGMVTDVYTGEDGLCYVECDIKVTNQNGDVTCPGRAVVILPKRDGFPVPITLPEPDGSQ